MFEFMICMYAQVIEERFSLSDGPRATSTSWPLLGKVNDTKTHDFFKALFLIVCITELT